MPNPQDKTEYTSKKNTLCKVCGLITPYEHSHPKLAPTEARECPDCGAPLKPTEFCIRDHPNMPNKENLRNWKERYPLITFNGETKRELIVMIDYLLSEREEAMIQNIKKEIEWCEKSLNIGEERKEEFINGLKRGIAIIRGENK